MLDKLSDAIIFAATAHKGQISKVTQIPYILHPLQVASIIGSITQDEDVIIAGLLHDVLEDTNTTADQILEKFGPRVLNLVLSETEDKHPEIPKGESWKTRKMESLEALKNTSDINVKILWLSDKLSNIRSFYSNYLQLGPKMWDSFNQKDPSMHKWYFSEVLQYTKELSNTHAYIELQDLYNKLFNEVKDND